jgi:hypothetical protein
MPVDDATHRLLIGAHGMLEPLGVRAVELGGPVSGGGGRSHLVRAIADRGRDTPLRIILKMPADQVSGFGRERAGLSLVRDYQLPGAVQLLGVIQNPKALILEDLGDGLSVADHLLGNSGAAAERAVIDWARSVGGLHAASTGLGDIFAERLSRFAGEREPVNLNQALLTTAVERLSEVLAPYDIAPSPAALTELRLLLTAGEPLRSQAEAGLVPGDCCPDNALYKEGKLILIDFESAAYRPAAWDAAYLTVPWPTCWCSWALPADASQKAMAAWREAAGPSAELTDDDAAVAEILWAMITLGFRLPRITNGTDPAETQTDDAFPRPSSRAVLLHRLAVAANAATSALPNLRALTATAHAVLEAHWGEQTLPLAPAFRDTTA